MNYETSELCELKAGKTLIRDNIYFWNNEKVISISSNKQEKKEGTTNYKK
jgi:hypothetical protein